MNQDPPSYYAGMSLQDAAVERDGCMVLRNVAFDSGAATLTGVFGRNGAGQSTLFNAIAGLQSVHQGRA